MNGPPTRTVLELERSLHSPPEPFAGPDLGTIRASGRRRRRLRRVVTGSTTLAVVGVTAGLAWTLAWDGGTTGDGVAVDVLPTPTSLSPLAKRALREVPGATKVSAYQVVLPDPGVPTDMDEPIDPDRIRTEPIEVGAHAYTGVTLWPRGTFPKWLRGGIEEVEKAAGDASGYPVGSLAEGIAVDQGPLALTCLSWEGDTCGPTLIHRTGTEWYLDWGMGSDDFLDEGASMEVFSSENFSSGGATTLWIAGIDGEVARADFVQTDGSVLEEPAVYDRVTSGDSFMWADVPGNLAKVVAYDADGDVIEDHSLKPCDSPVECEVR